MLPCFKYLLKENVFLIFSCIQYRNNCLYHHCLMWKFSTALALRSACQHTFVYFLLPSWRKDSVPGWGKGWELWVQSQCNQWLPGWASCGPAGIRVPSPTGVGAVSALPGCRMEWTAPLCFHVLLQCLAHECFQSTLTPLARSYQSTWCCTAVVDHHMHLH